jgi:hypothetical protein
VPDESEARSKSGIIRIRDRNHALTRIPSGAAKVPGKNETSPQARSANQPAVESSRRRYRWPVTVIVTLTYCTVCFFQPVLHRSSEYHEGAAWRARGPPMTVTEARTQYSIWQFFLSPTGAHAAVRGAYHTYPPPTRFFCWPVRCCLSFPPPTSDNMVFRLQPGTGIASRTAGYCDWRIQSRPACGSTVTHCILMWVLHM